MAGGSAEERLRERLATGDVLFDTMILTFAAKANRENVLRDAFGDRAILPPFVRNEVRRRARRQPAIRRLNVPAEFGRTYPMTPGEARIALAFQRSWHSLAKIQADPHLDRGEAECLAIGQATGMVVVSHDARAISAGSRMRPPVQVASIIDIVAMRVERGAMTPQAGWKVYEAMCAAGMFGCQGWPMDSAPARARSRERLLAWLDGLR
jgi:predicted nucleic acid-binding protein